MTIQSVPKVPLGSKALVLKITTTIKNRRVP
jgi:hypothetical protein